MQLGLLVPQTVPNPIDVAVEAEAMGYESAWVPELWWNAAPVQLAELAVRTDAIELGTAIVNVFSRTPAVLAMTASSLDRLSEGRFTLGVGTSTQKAVEDLHGMDWDDPNPVRRAHETIELTRRFLAEGDRVEYDGEVFSVRDFPSLGADVPIYHAALGRANRRVVARLCDGWIPHNVPFADLEEAFEYVADHARDAGRDPNDVTVAPYVPSCVSDDGDEARDMIRQHLAYYVGNGEGYRRAVATRFPDEADEVADRWRAGDRGEAANAVTDDMVAALGVAGTPDEAREQLRELAAMDAVDRPLLTIPNGAAHLAERTLEELAPERF